ncbi:hypothetical protein GKO32_18620 [Amycolatopsis sp. RM579]|uniref:Uncharacterized protein n=2 Tax=Amycolatopsis pithecellobii TaxID=664692 RepID=A0A6N7YSG1_9PSEU|nr:hypothetical protein [Amycolatopsis pithecellobii]
MAAAALLLTGCAQVDSATDKASLCSEALGLSNLNPNLSPDELARQAQDKANRLRELANRAADQDLKQNLSSIADSYVALEKQQASRLADVNEWVQRNAQNIDALRKACF